MFRDFAEALGRPAAWLYTTWIQFHILYRRTAVGPLWVILAPLALILLLGFLYSALSNADLARYFPHLTVGYVVWMFIGEVVGSSSALYVRAKGALMSGVTNHAIFHLRLIAQALIKFVHRILLIVGVCLVFNVAPTKQLLLVIPAVMLLIVHSLWVSVVFSLFAARFRDVAEVTELIMRIGFLATPVIWIPTEGARGSLVGNYLLFNPFYHVLEPVRSAVLGTSFPTQSLWISSVLALFGMAIAAVAYARYRRQAVWWI